MDVWQYAKIEEIELPSLYFAHEREVIEENGSLLAITDFVSANENEEVGRRPFGFARSETLPVPVRSFRMQVTWMR